MLTLRALARETTHTHRAAAIGRSLECITLHTPDPLRLQGRTNALTDTFLPVEIEGTLPANLLVRVLLTGINASDSLTAYVKQ
jgi:hypothetical protein